ncbi:MAG: nucleoside deaminase [Sumerlaeia bacterium]
MSLLDALDHDYFMALAITKASHNPRQPFGAVIVHAPTKTLVAEGCNATYRDCTLHGEIVAIQDMEAKKPGLPRDEMVLYTTGEPCPMCAAAIVWSGIGAVVYASDMAALERAGFKTFDLRAEDVTAKGPRPVPYLGGVRRGETDPMFVEAIERGGQG